MPVDKTALASTTISGIAEFRDPAGNPVVVPIIVDTNYSPYRLIVELPDRALRDLGIVDIGNQVPIGHGTDAIYNGTTALVPKFAVISASSAGNNEVVAAVASKKIRVLQFSYVSAGTVNVKWNSGATTMKSGLNYWISSTGVCRPFSPIGWFETAAGEALNINLSDAVAVGGDLTYVEV